MSIAHVYAELLPSIQVVTVAVTLPSASTKGTEATVSAEGQVFSVKHKGVTTSLELPTRLAQACCQNVKIMDAQQQLSFRFKPQATTPIRHLSSRDEVLVPWDAQSLSNETVLKCRVCNTDLLRPSAVRNWKDLPSANWAEMMDFWHCHKPDLPRGAAQVVDKGYTASSSFSAVQGTGLVDHDSFVLFPMDCISLQVRLAFDAVHLHGRSS